MTRRHFALHDEHPERGPDRVPADTNRQPVGLYVDRSTRRWVVRDPQGELWQLGATDAWDERRPFELTDETELEIVPSHYRYMLDLPF
ncbi:MAG TPA: hypothetical protein VF170_04610 [Planctomycetaceae bacterium]